MNDSKLMAQRFALDLNGLALGMWEAAAMLKKNKKAAAVEKIEWIRCRLDTLRKKPVFQESLRMHLHEDFEPNKFTGILDRLSTEGKSQILITEIESLIDETRGYLHESNREESGVQRTF